MSTPFFSVIVCSIDPWKFAQVSTHYERLLKDVPHEIIGIHDARSLTGGYNSGLQRARGDIVIFSHDDMTFIDPEFAQKIGERMQAWDILGFAGAQRMVYPVWYAAQECLAGAVAHWSTHDGPLMNFVIYGAENWPVTGGIETLDGMCMIARHEVATAVGFDADTFDAWHLYDLDFSFAASLAGYKIGVCCDIPCIHTTTSLENPDQAGFRSPQYYKYAQRFIQKYKDRREIPHVFGKQVQAIQCSVKDHKSLTRLWTEDVFRRATITIARQYRGETP